MERYPREQEPEPATHEFELHKVGERRWVPAWIVQPAKEPPGSAAIKIKIHWYFKRNGREAQSKEPMIYRWLRTPEQRARLRFKQKNL